MITFMVVSERLFGLRSTAACSSLTGGTMLVSLSKILYPLLITWSTQEMFRNCLKIVNKDVKNQLTTKLLSVGPNLASVKLWPCHAE